MKKIMVLSICLFFIFSAGCTGAKGLKNEQIEKKIEGLLSKMTLEEKIGQMNQISSYGNLEEMSRLIKKGEVGSILNEIDPVRVNALQRLAMEESRLGIPLLIARDVIHGFKTIFPIPLGQAASFNPTIVESGARIAAIEASSAGINWTFTPMLDISRDARWGRIAESLGEDTYLASILGAAMVKGFQTNDLSNPTSIASCVKHFVGYGAAEGGRDYNSTNIPPYLMRNVYLPTFEASIKAGAATVMTSFNDNDGIPSSSNTFLLRNILRDEWKFDGFVVSDWGSMEEMITHGFAKDRKQVAQLSANAGLDMEMQSGTYMENLPQLAKEGKVSVKVMDDAVRNILRIKFRLGLFDKNYTEKNVPSEFYSPDHLLMAKKAAVQSAILLKNENNTLPLKTGLKVAIIGPLADAPHEQLGTWVLDAEKSHSITPLKALEKDYPDVQFVYEPVLAFSRDQNKEHFSKAISAVQKSDVAIVFLGEESILSGEAHSLSNINLVGVQSELLEAVKSVGKPVVLVIIAGRPLTIERDLKNADAVLYNFHPGTMGGPAIMDLIYGKENPSGKLPVTFVREVGQIPMYYNHNNTGRPVQGRVTNINEIPVEAIQYSLGNTSYYLDSGNEPLYPFGYGLSYSKFEYSEINVSAKQVQLGDSITITAMLKNNSNIDGTEISQLYIQDVVGSIIRPIKELKGFQRIFLKANESKEVKFSLSTNDLAFWGLDMKFKAEPGDFNVWIGSDSKTVLKDSFTIK